MVTKIPDLGRIGCLLKDEKGSNIYSEGAIHLKGCIAAY